MQKKLFKMAAIFLTILSLLTAGVVTASAADQEVAVARTGYGWFYGDWETWNFWGVNYEPQPIKNGVVTPPLQSNPENGVNGKYRKLDHVVGYLSASAQINKIVLKSNSPGEFPRDIQVKTSNAKAPSDIEIATDSWAATRLFEDDPLVVNVTTAGDTMTIVFSRPVSAQAVMIQAVDPEDQTTGGASAWSVKEFRVYNGASYVTPTTKAPTTTVPKPVTQAPTSKATAAPAPTPDPGEPDTPDDPEESTPEETTAESQETTAAAAATTATDADNKKVDTPDKGGFPWVPVVIVAAVVLLGGGGTAAFFLYKKKKATPIE